MWDNLDKEKDEAPGKDNPQWKEPDEATSKRHAEQMAWAKQEVDRVMELAIDAAETAAKVDVRSLEELYQKDPKLADEVAKRFDYDNFKEIKEKRADLFEENQELDKKQPEQKEDFEKWYQERKSKEEHENALEEAEKIFNEVSDSEAREEIEKHFKKLAEGRNLTKEDAKEYAKMATLYVSQGSRKEEIFTNALAKLGSVNSVTSSKQSKSDDDELVVVNGKLLTLKELNNG